MTRSRIGRLAALILMACPAIMAMTLDSPAKPKVIKVTTCHCGCTWYSAPGIIGGSSAFTVTVYSSTGGAGRCTALSGKSVKCKGHDGVYGVCSYTGEGTSGQGAAGNVRAPATGGVAPAAGGIGITAGRGGVAAP